MSHGVRLARWHHLIADRVHMMGQFSMLARHGRERDDPYPDEYEQQLRAQLMPEFLRACELVMPQLHAVDPALSWPNPNLTVTERQAGSFTFLDISAPVQEQALMERYATSQSGQEGSGMCQTTDEWIAGLSEERLLHVTAHEAHRAATRLVAAHELPVLLDGHENASTIISSQLRMYASLTMKEWGEQKALQQRWGQTWQSDTDLRQVSIDEAAARILS